jgi:hypothetical protein
MPQMRCFQREAATVNQSYEMYAERGRIYTDKHHWHHGVSRWTSVPWTNRLTNYFFLVSFTVDGHTAKEGQWAF